MSDPKTSPTGDPSSLQKPIASRRVLLVEDDMVSGSALTSILKRRGLEVTHVTTIAQGFARLSEKPDIVILDLMLPDGNGEQILHRIRQQNLSIRVLVTTAVNDPKRLLAVRELKPDMLLQKPIDLTRLLAGVELQN